MTRTATAALAAASLALLAGLAPLAQADEAGAPATAKAKATALTVSAGAANATGSQASAIGAERAAMAASTLARATWPTVRSGQRGVDVATVQLLLTAQGYVTQADGIFGPATAAKVRAFQKTKHLTTDGIVGPNTWSQLIITLKTGSKGPAVTALQRQLTDNGYPLTADGMFGPATAAKVKAFQRAKHLTTDGITGPATWAALVTGSSSGSPTGSRAALAKQILNTSGISLATVHSDGRHAGSTARQNIIDTAHGKGALTSPWGDAPYRRVLLDTRMLNGLLKLRTVYGYRVSVSEIVGGDHSAHSKHYAGLAIDISYINGRHVGSGAPHQGVMRACKKLGAKEVLGPGDPGHSTHVHCGWPR